MPADRRGGESVGRSWWGFAVSTIGWVVAFVVVLWVVIRFGLFDRYPQQARVLLLAAPLGIFLVLLAYYQWIESVTVPVVGVTFDFPSNSGSAPSPDRRTLVTAVGTLVAVVGGFWHFVGVDRVPPLLPASSSDGGTPGSSDGTTTATDTPPEQSVTPSVLETHYGERRYGHHTYGG
jgi:hypothetical protein